MNRDALDRYITGNWGEDSVPDDEEATEELLEETLENLLSTVAHMDREELENLGAEELFRSRVRTFKSEMLLTHDRGLVLRLQGGEEFQVTIKRSR